MTFRSIRFLLLISVNLVVIIVLGLTAWRSYRNTLHELDELFDAELAQITRFIQSMVQNDQFLHDLEHVKVIKIPEVIKEIEAEEELEDYEDDSESERHTEGHRYETKIAFQVWTADKKLVMASENALDTALAKMTEGYQETYINGFQWIAFAHYDEQTNYWIFAGQREDVRNELSGYLADDQLYPILLTWVPISIAVFFLVNLTLRPINEFVEQLTRRKADQLTPIQGKLPREIEPIRKATNELFARVNTYIERENRFIADASHELRTPLAGLSIHADNLLEADNLEQTQTSAQAIRRVVRRMTHLVNQLLSMARVDRQQQLSLEAKAIAIEPIVTQVIAQLPADCVERVQWNIAIEKSAKVLGNDTLIYALLRNLIENAVKFSPENGEINVSTTANQDTLELTVRNAGAQLSADDLRRLGERFYRSSTSQQTEGAGLGLSIVQRIVELHQATISYASPATGGLSVTITFKQ
ncbi:two-component sensor histidine kinase [Idiomarina tyrosinivorans]|uniref:histidine kinase n=1 Tax=Idiomarina tyrosinivorans TaxID=1445662 RepID=A0A432ZSZ3_9GAMM|nr:ATP-binding protein [Idiomarina tyrosinivorans]RUO80982.1 two-component sensor histidine kinase [Idiomarina tyrosinivorans]